MGDTNKILSFLSFSHRTYGREISAHRWMSAQLIKLKIKYLREQAIQKIRNSINDQNQIAAGCISELLSIQSWLANPPTLLSPSLIACVDYRGFRVVVLPLYYRVPVKVNPESLGVGNRIATELEELSIMTGIVGLRCPCGDFSTASSSPLFEVLQLEKENPTLCVLHKVSKNEGVLRHTTLCGLSPRERF